MHRQQVSGRVGTSRIGKSSVTIGHSYRMKIAMKSSEDATPRVDVQCLHLVDIVTKGFHALYIPNL